MEVAQDWGIPERLLCTAFRPTVPEAEEWRRLLASTHVSATWVPEDMPRLRLAALVGAGSAISSASRAITTKQLESDRQQRDWMRLIFYKSVDLARVWQTCRSMHSSRVRDRPHWCRTGRCQRRTYLSLLKLGGAFNDLLGRRATLFAGG